MHAIPEPTQLALKCLTYAQELQSMWGHCEWQHIRVKAESLFEFLADARSKIMAIEEKLPEGCPAIIPLCPVPSGTGGLFAGKEKITGHSQAVRVLSSLVARIDKGGIVGQGLQARHERSKPVPVELPVGFGELKKWILYESALNLPS